MRGVQLPLLAHPQAHDLPPAHDPGHRLLALVAGLAEPHFFHRLAHVVRREPFEHLRSVELARRTPGVQSEKVCPLGALLVEMPSGRRFRRGTGFSVEERREPPPLDATVTYKHFGKTRNGVPRFASFLRIRDEM